MVVNNKVDALKCDNLNTTTDCIRIILLLRTARLMTTPSESLFVHAVLLRPHMWDAGGCFYRPFVVSVSVPSEQLTQACSTEYEDTHKLLFNRGSLLC